MTIIFDLIKSIHITSDLSVLKREICLEYNLQNKTNFRSEDFHNLAYNISKRFKPCKGNRKYFQTKNKNYLATDFKIDKIHSEKKIDNPTTGEYAINNKKVKKFSELSRSQQYKRKAWNTANDWLDINEIKQPKRMNQVSKMDALFYLYAGPNGGFSKEEYEFARTENAKHGISYPCYKVVASFRNTLLPPFKSDSHQFKVTLQDMHNNMTERLLAYLKEYHLDVYNSLVEEDSLILTGKTGADGQGSMGNHNTKETLEGNINDSSIYNVCYVPMSLKTRDGRTIWLNEEPNSPYLTKPLYCGFKKETHDEIATHYHDLKLQEENLKPKEFLHSGGKVISVYPTISNTMYDGKSVVAISKEINSKSISYLSCPICLKRGDEFTDPNIFKTNDNLNPEILDLGPSVLHCLLRSMEGLFNLGVRAKVGPGFAMTSEEYIKVKEEMKNAFKEKLNLKLFVVCPKFGTTNNGNACRKFFLEAETTAAILDLPVSLIRGIGELNKMLSDPNQVYDAVQYELKARQMFKIMTTTERFKDLAPMSPTIHRIIVHGAKFIKHFKDVPIGALSESALEHRNKYVRQFRNSHSRRGSTKNCIHDIGVRLFITTDIVFFMLRKRKNKRREPTICLERVQPPAESFISRLGPDFEYH